jgi:hypothetical protein
VLTNPLQQDVLSCMGSARTGFWSAAHSHRATIVKRSQPSDVLSHALCFLPFPAATPLFAIHNTVHNWEAPAQYRPERWLDVPVEAYVYDSTTNTTGGEWLPDAAGLQQAATLFSSLQSHSPSLQAVLLSRYYWQPGW